MKRLVHCTSWRRNPNDQNMAKLASMSCIRLIFQFHDEAIQYVDHILKHSEIGCMNLLHIGTFGAQSFSSLKEDLSKPHTDLEEIP